ncbi:short-chain dehydrogenase/reductase [Burkholderia sp. JP2-270]|nr:short-chain dehydrogenase/reductase [Burkholderia sp. JP2-270]
MKKTWLITGASRGLGLEMAKAVLAAGDNVVATGRNPSHVQQALGEHNHLLVQQLDVNDRRSITTAVNAAVERFGRIDVLVNNAGYGHLGFFEETTAEDVKAQFDSNVFGLMDVTRTVLPVMRAAGSGRIFNLSSLAGMRGSAFSSLYCASKFAVEGFSESLAAEVAPFGIKVTIVAPGPFRTDFLSTKSLQVGSSALPDYDAARDKTRATFEERNGKQAGDPVRLAAAMIQLAKHPEPPMRFVAGSAALQIGRQKLAEVDADLDAWQEVSEETDGKYTDTQAWRPANQS